MSPTSRRGGNPLTLDIGASPSTTTSLSHPQPPNESSSLLQGGTVNAIVAPPRRIEEENAVERALYSSLHGLVLVFVLILVGILSLLLRAMDPQLSLLSYWVIFVPFWLADFVAFGLQIYILVLTSSLRFYNPEQKRNVIQ